MQIHSIIHSINTEEVHKMNYKAILFALFSILILGACSSSSNSIENTDDVRALVDEYSAGNFTDDHTASISSTELIITNNDESQEVYDLPEDEFFVSIAPFETETHECDIHSLTGCQGELNDVDFDVFIENEDGEVIVDETMNAGKNGFVDVWLPRDHTYDVKIEHDGKTVESELSTFADDGTCITTMQLI